MTTPAPSRVRTEAVRLIRSKKAIAVAVWAYLFALSWTLPLCLSGRSFAACLLFAVVPAALAFALAALALAALAPAAPREGNGRIPAWPWCFAALAALWSLVLLVNWPGTYSTDSADIVRMASGLPFESDHFRYDSLNTHHPLAYVAFNALVLKAASLLGMQGTAALGLLSWTQLLVFAACCAFFVSKVASIARSRAAWWASFVFFAANPLLAQYATTLWKDILFSGFFLVFAVQLLACVLDPERFLRDRRETVVFVLAATLCCILRSNGFLAVAAALIVLVIVTRRHLRRIAPVCAIVLCAAGFCIGALPSLVAAQPGHFSESVGIALQQLARTASEDGSFTEEQKAFIDEIVPFDRLSELYLPASANPIKFDPDFDDEFLESHKAEFLATWVLVGLDNPGSYIRAWCAQTQAFWNIGAGTWYTSAPGYPLDDATNYHEDLLAPVVDSSDIATATELAIEMFAPLYDMGTLVWFVLFALLAKAIARDTKGIACLAPFATLWATFLVAAPAGDFRYLLPLHAAIPLVALVLLTDFRQTGTGGRPPREAHPENNEVSACIERAKRCV